MVTAIRYFDMFSGIGGFRSGLERAGGFKCIGNCEIDKHAEAAYKAMYNTEGEAYYKDARTIDTESLGDFDLIAGGFPCQSFSVAGRRLGLDDERGDLFLEIARLIEAKRPAFFLLENVPGLLSHNKGKTFKVIITKFSELGYSFEWMVLNSAHFGVPQQRRRVFIVGYTRKECAGRIFPLEQSDAKDLRCIVPNNSQGKRVYDASGTACTQCAGDGGASAKTGLYFIDNNRNPVITENARCITARQDSGTSNHRGEHSAVLVEDEYWESPRMSFIDTNANPKITDHARCITAKQISGASNYPGEHSGVLVETAPCAVINPFKETVRQNGRRIKEPNEPMYTITVQDRHGVLHCGRIRRLMPIECWRLQGFTDEQFYTTQSVCKGNTHLYRMAGNSVTVPVITAIAHRIKAAAEMIGLDTT